MPIYQYVAKNETGEKVQGRGETSSSQALAANLRKKGLWVISIQEAKVKDAAGKGQKGGKVGLIKVAIFCRQLATLLEAGVPIVRAIRDLGEQSEDPILSRILLDMAEQIESGAKFSDALKKYPQVFSTLVCYMVEAGEESGNLTGVMDELTSYLEDQVALKRKIKGATAYPIFVAGFFIIAVSAIVFYLIPQFGEIFAGFDAELPFFTRLVLGISNFMIQKWYFEIGGIVAIIVGYTAYSKTVKGRYNIDKIKLKLPLFGKLVHKIVLVRFCRSLSTMIGAGVTVVSALSITSFIAGNVIIKESIENVREGIIQGSTVAKEMGKQIFFPKMLVRMVSVGEESGKLNEMLSKISAFYNDEVTAAINGLTSIIEPLLIILLGGVVAIVILALYFPIFQLAGAME